MLCTCEFCSTQFETRPQTKNPRACSNRSCQKARQRQNEKDWHQKNRELYLQNARYHQQQRIKRYRILSELINKLIEAIQAGILFKGISVKQELFKELFQNFMFSIGLRQINKFCTINESNLNQQSIGP